MYIYFTERKAGSEKMNFIHRLNCNLLCVVVVLSDLSCISAPYLPVETQAHPAEFLKTSLLFFNTLCISVASRCPLVVSQPIILIEERKEKFPLTICIILDYLVTSRTFSYKATPLIHLYSIKNY